MGSWKRVKQVLAAACCLALLLSAPAAAAAGAEPAQSSNQNRQDYSTWASTVKSYLYENGDGGLTRVEYTGGQVVIEDYNSGFQCLSSRTLAPELPIWGGFYSGEDFNFLVYGQENPGEDNSVEVIRVVKYGKDWNRLGQASLKGANTTVPFDAGSLRFDEYKGYLYIRTCHEMYASPRDGLNHQANLTLAVRQSDMAVTDSYFDVMNIDYGYVSHSFNQFLLVDSSGKLVALDHGDAYPRSLALCKYTADAGSGRFTGGQYSKWCSYSSILDFPGAVGDNTTGGSAGGLAETGNCYVMAYSYDQAGGRGERFPFYCWVDKSSGKGQSVQLAETPGCTTPILAPMGLDGGYVLWNNKTGGDDTLYCLPYGADGKPGQVRTETGTLSDCQPILYNGKAVWYVTNNSVPRFYSLDSTGVSAADASRASQPDTPPASAGTGFSDVTASDWFAPYVEKAASQGWIKVVGDGTFHPNDSVTYAQMCVMVVQAFFPEELAGYTGAPSPWYAPSCMVAFQTGLLKDTQIALAPTDADKVNQPCSRQEMALIVYNTMRAAKAELPSDEELKAAAAATPDYLSYTPAQGRAIAAAKAAGVLSGMDSEGTFSGQKNMNRAQAAAVMVKLGELL